MEDPYNASVMVERRLVGFLWLWAVGLVAGLSAVAAADEDGARIYAERCASCHGPSGEGVKEEYARPLAGDWPVDRLARTIERRMPDDEPELCVGDAAEAVARYIYDAFYSPIAQARNRPPRIERVRLTARQVRHAVADLVGSFRPDPPPPPPNDDGRGIRGRYYDSRQPSGRPALERIDSEVKFDFGKQNPGPETFSTQGFAARWEGSLHAPETGKYELIVRTDHGARLWVNDLDEPIIDVWVKSGSDTEYRAPIYLIDGRSYPIRLEFTSRNQGVEKEGDGKPIEAFLELGWKLPKRVDEVIPRRYLAPELGPESFVVDTPFPPDDRSIGYERGTSVSKAWDEATTAAAIEAAGYVARHVGELAGTRRGQSPAEGKLRELCERLVERAFRRPLTDAQKELYIARQLAAAPDPESAVKRVVILALKSPRFLYLDFGGDAPDGYAVASRLSFALWDSLPDRRLLEAAAAGKLGSREQVLAEAERMMRDPRTRAKLREFLHHWLRVESVPDLAKDPERFPGFDATVASDLRTSLDLFLDETIWGESGDFRKLLLSDELYLNGRLARFYGRELPENAPFQKVRIEEPRRTGILTHPYVLARFAYTDSTSPIHRGVFIIRSVLGRALNPPPAAFAPLAADIHPDLTTRERVALQTEPEACQACHTMINPLGFALEHFDAVGRYREDEGGRPIDASGAYETLAGDRKTFAGAAELASFLSESEEVQRGFALQLFHHLAKQPILAYGKDTPAKLREAFARDGFDVRKLLVEIATVAALAGTPVTETGTETTTEADTETR